MRKFSAFALLVAALTGLSTIPAAAGKPDVLFCAMPGKDGKPDKDGKKLGIILDDTTTIADAIQMCLEYGGHPAGVGELKDTAPDKEK